MTVKIPDCELGEERHWQGNRAWVTARLVELAKDLEVFDLPLKHIDISRRPWGSEKTIKNMAYHVKRSQKTDLSFPVIMDDHGQIMNGWHRILKALVEGRESVKAVRFEVTPPHCFTEGSD